MYNDFTPDYTFNGTSTLSPFEVWCQKVLPTIYDNSLSYYELLTKVVKYLNDTMENVNDLQQDVSELNKAYNQLVSYINEFKNYSDNRMDSQDEKIENLTVAWNTFQEEMQKVIDDIPNQVENAVDEYTETQAFTTKVKIAVDQSLQEAGAIPEISEINSKIGESSENKSVFEDLEEIKESVNTISISGVDDVNAKIGVTTDSQASSTDGTVMGKLNLLIKAGSGSGSTDVNVQAITDNIGNTGDANGTSSSGTVFGKLNKIITDITSNVVSKLETIANNISSVDSKVSNIETNTDNINTNVNAVETTTKSISSNTTSINSKIGNTSDGGATATTGSVMGKLNNLIENSINEITIDEKLNSSETSLDKIIPYNIALQDGLVIREFETNGNYTIPVPAWATSLKILQGCGAGGGGAYAGSYYAGAGGGGAAIENQIFDINNLKEITISIGEGGINGTSTTISDGGNGGPTTITEISLTLEGGKGGVYASTKSKALGGASGGEGGGAGGKSGANGEDGLIGSGGVANASSGGGGSIGAGGNGYNATDNILPTKPTKGGGGAGGYSSSILGTGGADGYIKLEWIL